MRADASSVSGFLFASKFGPFGSASIAAPLNLLLQHYTRLVVPYSAALLLAIACSAIASMWMDHRSISGTRLRRIRPVLLLHDLLYSGRPVGRRLVQRGHRLPAVRAGVLLLWLPSRLSGRVPALRLLAPALIVGMTLASCSASTGTACGTKPPSTSSAPSGLASWSPGPPASLAPVCGSGS